VDWRGVDAESESTIPQTVHKVASTWAGGKGIVRIDLDPEFNAIAHLRP
jgi:hypothetical protein